jgi:hypothetical protein
MISTIKKMPWYLPDQITVRQRNAIHSATKQLVRLLDIAVLSKRDPGVLKRQLKKRLVDAVLSCPDIYGIQKNDMRRTILRTVKSFGTSSVSYIAAWDGRASEVARP